METDDSIGDAGKGHGSLHETLSLTGKTAGLIGELMERAKA